MIRNELQAQLSARRQGIEYVGLWNDGQHYEFRDPVTRGNLTVHRSKDLRLHVIMHRLKFEVKILQART
jgi:hypothetical protein